MREKRRQIWVITLEYEPFIIGGLGTVATNLSKALARSGLQVTVLSRSPTSRFGITRKPRLSIIRFPKGPIYDRPAAAARWLMKRAFRKPDNIHIHSVQLANWAIFLRKKYKIPIFYTCHSLIAMEPGPLTKKRIIAESRQVQLLKIANKIVVPSRSELVHLKRRYPFSAKKNDRDQAWGRHSKIRIPRSASSFALRGKTGSDEIPRVEKRAIAGAIQRMWRNRKATRQRMIAARKLAARYSWPQAARRYKRLFQQSWKR